ncbi:RraA family protein [Phytohabitans kaempferiae]|uniref:Putative 4-hydroxy-4-methyl-2-oxoglutarate aldolase n=1 Tax=Phytohabitans kaempferiae TaxID=1620943 RepID=A0ABV6M4C8_9ACTN
MSDEEITAGFRALSTATVSDALDRLGLLGAAIGLAPLAPGQRMVGRAFTVRYVPVGVPAGTVGDYIDDVPAGSVVALDNAGRTDCTVWGDILTAVAHRAGIAGTVVNGVPRDVRRALDLGYPIYSRGRLMRTGKDRVEVAETGGTISLGTVQVKPGDLLIGDDDGVLAVPRSREADVLAAAREIAEREDRIVADALTGTSLRQARARYGYHALQQRVG